MRSARQARILGRILDADALDAMCSGRDRDRRNVCRVLADVNGGVAVGRRAVEAIARTRGVSPEYVIDRITVISASLLGVHRDDPYAILGIDCGAAADALHRRWRELAKIWHPDVARDPDAAIMFQRLRWAYEILRDPERRLRWEAEQRHGGGPQVRDAAALYAELIERPRASWSAARIGGAALRAIGRRCGGALVAARAAAGRVARGMRGGAGALGRRGIRAARLVGLAVADAAGIAWDTVGGGVGGARLAVARVIAAGMGRIARIGIASMTTVVAARQAAVERTARVVTGLGNGMAWVVTGLGNGIARVVTGLGTGMARAVMGLGNGIAKVVTGLGNGIARVVTGLGNSIAWVVTGLRNGMTRAAAGLRDGIAQVARAALFGLTSRTAVTVGLVGIIVGLGGLAEIGRSIAPDLDDLRPAPFTRRIDVTASSPKAPAARPTAPAPIVPSAATLPAVSAPPVESDESKQVLAPAGSEETPATPLRDETPRPRLSSLRLLAPAVGAVKAPELPAPTVDGRAPVPPASGGHVAIRPSVARILEDTLLERAASGSPTVVASKLEAPKQSAAQDRAPLIADRPTVDAVRPSTGSGVLTTDVRVQGADGPSDGHGVIMPPEAAALLGTFRRHYERRDVDELVALFEDDGIENRRTGRRAIAAAYHAAFESWRDVRYQLGTLRYEDLDDGIRVRSPFTITYARPSDARIVRGTAAWDIVRGDDGLRIARLSYALQP